MFSTLYTTRSYVTVYPRGWYIGDTFPEKGHVVTYNIRYVVEVTTRRLTVVKDVSNTTITVTYLIYTCICIMHTL